MVNINKLKQENKQLKELQLSQELAISLASEALSIGKEFIEKLSKENESLLTLKNKLETLENKLLDEYFLNTALERKAKEALIDNNKNKKLIELELVKQVGPIIKSVLDIVPLFTKTKEETE